MTLTVSIIYCMFHSIMSSCNRKKINKDEIGDFTPEQYEQIHVHDIYDQIAQHFSATRAFAWPNVELFLKSLDSNSIMVDVGCGNGKNLGISSGKNYGCDICQNLVDIAKLKGHDVKVCDALNLTYDDCFADTVISIAVIHHFVTVERRTMAIKEMMRILKPNGQILIYVWATKEEEDEEKDDCNNDYYVGWKNNYKDGKTEEKNYERYYHFFAKNELEELCLSIGGCDVEKSYRDRENWAVILRKH